MLRSSSRGALAFSALAVTLLVGAALGEAGWDPFLKVRENPPPPPLSALGLWEQMVKSKIWDHSEEFRLCWNDPIELGLTAPLRHSEVVPLAFSIRDSGVVGDVEVASLRGTETDECVRARLQALKLLRPPVPFATVATSIAVRPDDGRSFTAGDPRVSGSLDPRLVRRVIEEHHGEAAACYRQRLIGRSQLKGEVTVSFWIDEKGFVASPGISDDETDDEQLGRCLAAAVGTWSFPAPPGKDQVFVRYAFNFTPTGW